LGWPGWLPGPALCVILLSLVVHVVRQNVVDIVVFGTVAVLIVLEPRLPLRSGTAPRWLGRARLAVLAALVLALVVLATGRSSVLVQVVLGFVGVVALVVVLRAGPGAPPQVATPRWWLWVVVLLAGCVLELADFVSQVDPQTDNPSHPTLSAVGEPLLAEPLPRALVAAGWLLIGWWLVRLATQRDPGRGGSR
jgi:hypothetical protein